MKTTALAREREYQEMRRRAIAGDRAALTWLHRYHQRRIGVVRKGA